MRVLGGFGVRFMGVGNTRCRSREGGEERVGEEVV